MPLVSVPIELVEKKLFAVKRNYMRYFIVELQQANEPSAFRREAVYVSTGEIAGLFESFYYSGKMVKYPYVRLFPVVQMDGKYSYQSPTHTGIRASIRWLERVVGGNR